MIATIFILTLINTSILIGMLIKKFNDTFTIVNREVYDTLLDYWSDNHDEEGNEIERELPGGVGVDTGFFREELYEDEGEEEDE